ncbi:MAG TPA: hypothetical protein VF881_20555 [Polyangiaceae bacterium]
MRRRWLDVQLVQLSMGFGVELVARLAFAWIFTPLVPVGAELPALFILMFTPRVSLPIMGLAFAAALAVGRVLRSMPGGLLASRGWALALAVSAATEWPLRVIGLVENGVGWGHWYLPTDAVVLQLAGVGLLSGSIQAIALLELRWWAWAWIPMSAFVSGFAICAALNFASQLSHWMWAFQDDGGRHIDAVPVAVVIDAILIVAVKATALRTLARWARSQDGRTGIRSAQN